MFLGSLRSIELTAHPYHHPSGLCFKMVIHCVIQSNPFSVYLLPSRDSSMKRNIQCSHLAWIIMPSVFLSFTYSHLICFYSCKPVFNLFVIWVNSLKKSTWITRILDIWQVLPLCNPEYFLIVSVSVMEIEKS